MKVKKIDNKSFKINDYKVINSCEKCPFKEFHWTTFESFNYCGKIGPSVKVDGNSVVKGNTNGNSGYRDYYIDHRCPIINRI